MAGKLSDLLEGASDVLDFLDDPTDVNESRAEKRGRGERAKIVAWLRRQPAGATWSAEAIAAAIERGDHLR